MLSQKNKVFDLSKVPNDELVAFYGIHIAAAAADGVLEKEELWEIFKCMDHSSLSVEQKETLQKYIVEPPDLEEVLCSLKDACDEIRFATVLSMVNVMLADEVIDEKEQVFIDRVCKAFEINDEQRDKMVDSVKKLRACDSSDESATEEIVKNVVSGLVGAGVPMGAIYMSGSIVGFSAAGITSGLAALGAGGVVFGLSAMASGLVVVLLVGTGMYASTKWLLGKARSKSETKKDKINERMAQRTIKNQVEMIAGLEEKLRELESDASLAKKNADAIHLLKNRLRVLSEVADRKSASL